MLAIRRYRPFGDAFTEILVKDDRVQKIIIFARDYRNQCSMVEPFLIIQSHTFLLKMFETRIDWHALDDVDLVIHTATIKIVPTAGYWRFKFIRTNINVAKNLINTYTDKWIDRAEELSTDKARSPIDLCGATKLFGNELVSAVNACSGEQATKFVNFSMEILWAAVAQLLPFL